MDKMPTEKPLVIPVFIPHAGCPHQCAFCNQSIITSENHPLPSETDVRRTVDHFLQFKGSRKEVQLAFFGGNFLGLETTEIVRLLDIAQALVGEGKLNDIRCSTRPDTITRPILDIVKPYDLTTVELGVQSMDDDVLEKARRGHTRTDTLAAAELLKEAGIQTGMQMMVGLPGDTPQISLATARDICGMQPDFVRIYPLIVLKGSPLARWYAKGQYMPLSLDTCVTLVKELYKIFQKNSIPVIRMGLQASDVLQESDAMVAGPWHPAFGHLVFSALFLDTTLQRIKEKFPGTLPERITLTVHPTSQSRLRGDKNKNMETLHVTFPGTTFTVGTDSTLDLDAVILHQNQGAQKPILFPMPDRKPL